MLGVWWSAPRWARAVAAKRTPLRGEAAANALALEKALGDMERADEAEESTGEEGRAA